MVGLGSPGRLEDEVGQSKLIHLIIGVPINRAVQCYHCNGNNAKQ